VGPPGARPFDSACPHRVWEKRWAVIPYPSIDGKGREERMPMWVWILLIVLLVLLVFGGVGYGRRGV
jgi:hypothetical protein